jgi:hypothetical protein
MDGGLRSAVRGLRSIVCGVDGVDGWRLRPLHTLDESDVAVVRFFRKELVARPGHKEWRPISALVR